MACITLYHFLHKVFQHPEVMCILDVFETSVGSLCSYSKSFTEWKNLKLKFSQWVWGHWTSLGRLEDVSWKLRLGFLYKKVLCLEDVFQPLDIQRTQRVWRWSPWDVLMTFQRRLMSLCSLGTSYKKKKFSIVNVVRTGILDVLKTSQGVFWISSVWKTSLRYEMLSEQEKSRDRRSENLCKTFQKRPISLCPLDNLL